MLTLLLLFARSLATGLPGLRARERAGAVVAGAGLHLRPVVLDQRRERLVWQVASRVAEVAPADRLAQPGPVSRDRHHVERGGVCAFVRLSRGLTDATTQSMFGVVMIDVRVRACVGGRCCFTSTSLVVVVR